MSEWTEDSAETPEGLWYQVYVERTGSYPLRLEIARKVIGGWQGTDYGWLPEKVMYWSLLRIPPSNEIKEGGDE